MWFNSVVADAKNFMVEPELMDAGEMNFQLNGMKGDFTRAYIDAQSAKGIEGRSPTTSIDDLVQAKGISYLDILHSDIQGYELNMLKGAEDLLNKKNVNYIFISTHSQELHYECMAHLKAKNYMLICSADLEESYSWDGLLVFRDPDRPGIGPIDVSKRNRDHPGVAQP
jgi:FkbM family methyltransferase